MNWLTPTTGIVAAAVAVPLLVAMYFLRLRRTAMPVSSTLLWRRAVQDLQVNAPFQRLRRNLLLLLQLLALGCVLVGLAGPVISLDTGPGKRYVLLIDRSGSMNATDGAGGGTRLEQAKRQARQLVESLRSPDAFRLTVGPGGGDQAMVIAFDQHAKVMCSFTTDKHKLLQAIDAIELSDGPSDLAEALALARSVAHPSESAEQAEGNFGDTILNSGSSRTNIGHRKPEFSMVSPKFPQIELFSDGRVSFGDTVNFQPDISDAIVFHAIGSSSDNVAIVAMQARRSYERPEQVDIFASLANYSSRPAQCDVELIADGHVRAVRTVTVPGRVNFGDTILNSGSSPNTPPGQVGVHFSMTNRGGGLVMVRQSRRDGGPDMLASDDAAWAVLPPPRRLSVLLVTDGNPALTAGLSACPLEKFRQVSQAEFSSGRMLTGEGVGPLLFDLVVLDNLVADVELPAGRYLSFGRPPKQSGLSAGPEGKEPRRIIDWQANHPVLQHVPLDNLVAQRWWRLQADDSGQVLAAQTLARFADGPAIMLARRQNSVFLLVGFDAMESNWPLDAGFAMFCYNVTAFLGSEMSQADQTALPVGGVITVQKSGDDARRAEVAGPHGLLTSLDAGSGQWYRFADTRRAGVYTVTTGAGVVHKFAVNMLCIEESDIAPACEIRVGGRVIAASADSGKANQQLWPWLVLGGLVLVCIEWIVYNSRVRL